MSSEPMHTLALCKQVASCLFQCDSSNALVLLIGTLQETHVVYYTYTTHCLPVFIRLHSQTDYSLSCLHSVEVEPRKSPQPLLYPITGPDTS